MIQDARPSGAPFKRLFFALPVGQAQCRALAQWRRGLGLRSGKPVPAENFHVTLLFLGDVDPSQVPAICAAIDRLKRPQAPLRLPLDRLQVWQRASALVLEPGQVPVALRQLVYALQQAVLPLAVGGQPKEYRPHLTLARDFRAQVPEAQVAPDFHLTARSFVLYESRKGRYWPLAQWGLDDAGVHRAGPL
ncbi:MULTISPECIES: RNA 2',3'-cyclic phosphodiesterase [unclassified Pseudomonas]|uniref:RNA 2',3'-cyclic phosphodiesterase n=1 Tax=unclassified Pseudomonas TaxID=196821 RepID=UPI002447E17D|nr:MULTISPECIES: RNA 2',3'-cyclic phosphodiesterase [unclassified Pseudomonas]MDH0300842.1 RNA 2',3'-cyclic phosphodiesterase [Pseudomonas sp. GD04091]MDH1985249.1 RNA 2',3'-cyclic phosphodiesterase [Pseudomonas sp. GD03689]